MTAAEPEVKIRRMVGADLEQVKGIDELVVGEQRATSWPLSVEELLNIYRPALGFVAEVEGKIAGFLLGDIRRGRYGTGLSGWIDMIGVAPEHQRKGIARRLVLAFWAECQRRHIKANVLVREDDESVVKFFTAIGFSRGKLINLEM